MIWCDVIERYVTSKIAGDLSQIENRFLCPHSGRCGRECLIEVEGGASTDGCTEREAIVGSTQHMP